MVCGDSSLSDGLKLQPWKLSASGDEVREGMVKNPLLLYYLSGVHGGEGCGTSLPFGLGTVGAGVHFTPGVKRRQWQGGAYVNIVRRHMWGV
jgi:hypothetical protein